ncbi:TetR/AcrR family transcriptional regulator [Auritidibacter ignavus]|uniref:TetR family transcriptional regulator n=1 Tax=Auritidibacter ignavus TaxID=678932 RepID=A0AAJ6AIU4_9MICC|nr:TetR family transcriptional regulator [Auritidibacter ignavus]NIH71092.1 AcrR family transcriptional regulator [Auritidibacter ignavus]RMX22384.1 TetR family transcriptional regulator [Auritidibacter ignavus]WGH92807.1 TetR family transcriptional regulator [Auritidibacter ignavus]WHS28830.1 TetR family transcriptional regulator [Auritidibacter ignavus]
MVSRKTSAPIVVDDLIRCGLEILRTHGLADVSMRRVATTLGVRPSALYWHVKDKQSLLALMADEILAGMKIRNTDSLSHRALTLYQGLLATRDAAELVSSVIALGTGGNRLRRSLRQAREMDQEPDPELLTDTLVSLILGAAVVSQQRLQAEQLGLTTADTVPERNQVRSDFAQMLKVVIPSSASGAEGLRVGAPQPHGDQHGQHHLGEVTGQEDQ